MLERDEINKYFNDMFAECTVKDGGEYVLGRYDDKIAVYGYYIKPNRDSLADRVTSFANKKFILEMDYENFSQLALLCLYESILKFDERGQFEGKEIKDLQGLLYTNTKYKLMDIAKLGRMTQRSICDRKNGNEYKVNKLESYEEKFIEQKDRIKNQKDERYISEHYDPFNDEEETSNEFIKWFNEHKVELLTKKQLDFIEGNTIYKDTTRHYSSKNNIYKRVTEAYEKHKDANEKILNLNKKLELINRLLDFNKISNLASLLVRIDSSKNNWIILKIYENINMHNCSKLTTLLIDNEFDEDDKSFWYDVTDALIVVENDLLSQINEIKEKSLM
ncbi:hypothetical protein [Clostridium sp.]|uniref:hypothetical protein n=1 Tax=Clostridium sp. TaxID=1506 RepID=UPI003F2D2C82